MEIASHALWTMIHGMLFGALYLLACSGALVALYRCDHAVRSRRIHARQERFLRLYLIAMIVLAWAAVLTGAYIVYPWYRAAPPPGTVDLGMFPRVCSCPAPPPANGTRMGMEWKEHVAWFAAIAITMVGYVFIRYGRRLANHRQLRAGVIAFAVASFFAASVAGFFGAMINKYAPIQGGAVDPNQPGRRKMNKVENPIPAENFALANGPGAAAILAAGVGCFALSVLSILADKSAPIKNSLVLYKPTGALSGVTTGAILVWLLTWAVLEWRWSKKTVAAGRIGAIAIGLMVLGIMLTFPPIGDLF